MSSVANLRIISRLNVLEEAKGYVFVYALTREKECNEC